MPLKIMTYNIHGGRDFQGQDNLAGVAAILHEIDPHLAGFNEVAIPILPAIKGIFASQPTYLEKLGRLTNRQVVFSPTLKRFGLPYFGNGLLTKIPLTTIEHHLLPGKLETRGCILAQIPYNRKNIWFGQTHLGLSREDRYLQLKAIKEILLKKRDPIILAGDFNTQSKAELKVLESILIDSQAFYIEEKGLTYPSLQPESRIDYIWVTHHFKILQHEVINSMASDHLPVLVTLELT